jgi:hypothetical protein
MCPIGDSIELEQSHPTEDALEIVPRTVIEVIEKTSQQLAEEREA